MTISFKLYREFGALNSGPVFDAFEQGLKTLGYTSSTQGEVAVIWSVLWNGRMLGNRQVFNRSQQNNKPIIVLEVGGIQRGTTWKVGINGINHGCFSLDNLDPNRPNRLGLELQPWRTSGDHILICGQHERSLQWQSMPKTSQWVFETINTLRQYTDRKIVVRPHPRSPFTFLNARQVGIIKEQPRMIPGTYDDYDMKFKGVHAVINWSSNPGIRAVLNGVPAFVGPHSLAYDVANYDLDRIESPAKPDRESWLVEYAHTEWTLDEIASGQPLSRLMPKIQEQLS